VGGGGGGGGGWGAGRGGGGGEAMGEALGARPEGVGAEPWSGLSQASRAAG